MQLDLNLNGDGAWSDLATKTIVEYKGPLRICTLDNGMESGKPSVAFRFDLPDGRVLFAQTSVALFQTAAAAMRGKYGDVT